MKNDKQCHYIRGKSPKRIYCADGCFVKFLNTTELNRFYVTRCMGRQDKCNVYKTLLDREIKKRRGDGK